MTEIPKGYVQNPDGSYSHPSRVRVAADANREHAQQAGALGGAEQAKPAGQGSVGAKAISRRGSRHQRRAPSPVLRVTITSYRRRLLDDDNLVAGCKALRDAVADSLGVDDGSPLVEWRCLQVQAQNEGTLVTIWKQTYDLPPDRPVWTGEPAEVSIARMRREDWGGA